MIDDFATEMSEPLRRFHWLLENDFLTLEAAAVSERSDDGMNYVGEWSGLEQCFAFETNDSERDATELRALHGLLYTVAREVSAVVTGMPAHLLALRAEQLDWPDPTSTMKKRNVTDLASHVVDSVSLHGTNATEAIRSMRERSKSRGMDHLLMIREDGLVCVGAGTLADAMVHYQNVVMCSQASFLRHQQGKVSAINLLQEPL